MYWRVLESCTEGGGESNNPDREGEGSVCYSKGLVSNHSALGSRE